MADKPGATEYLKNLQFSINQQRGDFERMISLQASYDNRINPAIWPTQSEIPTAQHFTMVEEALANTWESLFPESDDVHLLPMDAETTPEQWANAEWALKTMVNHRIGLKKKVYRSLKDCFKCGIGYAIVENIFITPAASREIITKRGVTRILTDGSPQRAINVRHLSPGSVIPYPDGVDFNGPDATSMCFMLDFFPQWQMEQLYDGKFGRFEPSTPLKDVLANAKSLTQAGVTDMMRFAEILGGRKRPRPMGDMTEYAPVSIPIIRVWEQPGTEIWISPSSSGEGDIILKIEVEDQQHRIPLVKFDASPDSDRWYPMSMAQADQSRGLAYDMWLNFLFDQMTLAKDSIRVVDRSALPAGQDRIYPGQDLYIAHGNATTAAHYLEPPRIDPQIMNVGDILGNVGRRIQGTSDMTGRNYTRGGAAAFQDLLNTAQSRQRLAIMVLEMGAIKQLYEHIFILMRDNVPDDGMEMVRPVWSPEDSYVSDRRTITPDDLKHNYETVIDTSARRMLGGMDTEMRFRMAQEAKNDEMAHPYEARMLYPVPDTIARRLWRSRARMEELQEQQRQAALAQQQAEMGQQQPQMEGQVPIEGMMQ